MNRTKQVRPSPSYSISVPAEVTEDYDDRVVSFWFDGKPLLLQLSSYIRSHGDQATAQSRLQERMKKHPGEWKIWSEKLHPDSSLDQAAAELLDEKHVLWVHSYLVWPHLTVYALISGPASDVRDSANWARSAVATIELAVH